MSMQNVAGITPNALQQRHLVQSPNASFFSDFEAAYTRYQSASAPSTTADANTGSAITSLADVMGLTYTEMAAVRGTSASEQSAYAAILDRAYREGGMQDPVAFLNSLTPQEQDVVQRAHSLADPINPASMSQEGAYNLLLPDGYQVDLNQDGIEDVGAAKTISFPPLDAPEQVKQAWLTATQNMNEGDMLTYQLQMHTMLYGVRIDDLSSHAPAATDQLASYQQGVDKFLAWLESAKASIPAEQYARDYQFFSEMKRLLA